jgi:hypothetical protein
MTPEQRERDIAERRHAVEKDGKPVQHKIWIRDDWTYRDVYKVPIERLVLNIDNKRFSAERELVEHRLGRPLDPANSPVDEESIVAILCDASLDVDLDQQVAIGTPSKDFTALKEDWQKRGQAEPLWIRPDGTVRNGNRRLAMLKRLRAEGADTNYVEAIILAVDDVDEAELFRMEQREQLAENFKKRYQDVNALLALKDAADLEGIDWTDDSSITEVAKRLKHYAGRDDAGYAAKQLYAIRALDQYLAYINAPGRYSLASRQVEVFREVGLCMAQYNDDPEQQFELLQAAFAFVQAGRRYGEIRTLRGLFSSDRQLFDTMVEEILGVEAESGWNPEGAESEVEFPELSDATAPTDDEDDEDDDLGPVVGSSGYPKAAVSTAITSALDRYTASNLDITKQLSQALVRLEAVDLPTLASLTGAERQQAQSTVEAIRSWVEQALDHVR